MISGFDFSKSRWQHMPPEQKGILKAVMEQKKRRNSKKLIDIYFEDDIAKILDNIDYKGDGVLNHRLLIMYWKEQCLL